MVMEDGISTIVANCTTCGHVRVAPCDVTIRNCVDSDEWSYWFRCPTCQRRAAGTTHRGPALDAILSGSAFETWRTPAEVFERPEGSPFTYADVLELRLRLIEPDWTDELT